MCKIDIGKLIVATALVGLIGTGQSTFCGFLGAATLGYDIKTSVSAMAIGGALLWGAIGATLGLIPNEAAPLFTNYLHGDCLFAHRNQMHSDSGKSKLNHAVNLFSYTTLIVVSGLLGYLFWHVRDKATLSLGEQLAASTLGAVESSILSGLCLIIRCLCGSRDTHNDEGITLPFYTSASYNTY